MKNKKSFFNPGSATAFGLGFFIIMSVLSCKKETKGITDLHAKEEVTIKNRGLNIVNPLSLSNIRIAKSNLTSPAQSQSPLDSSRMYIYGRFNPRLASPSLVKEITKDKNFNLYDLPIGNPNMILDAEITDTINYNLYRDGKFYFSVKLRNPTATMILATPGIEAMTIDTLYLPSEAEEDLEAKAMVTANIMTESEANAARGWCKRPQGHVRYLDTKDNTYRPVVNIAVWAVHWGTVAFDQTDENGYFFIDRKFCFTGTVIGTMAKNERINIRPVNLSGTVVQIVHQLIPEFLLGGLTIEGYWKKYSLENISITWGNHSKKRTWAHILNALYYHDLYCANDLVEKGPEFLNAWSVWKNTNGYAHIGSDSAPMFGHFSGLGGDVWEPFLQWLFDNGDFTIADDVPNFFSATTGFLPDLLFQTTDVEQTHYSEMEMEFIFHELGHSMIFKKVGESWWTDMVYRIIENVRAGKLFPPYTGNPYGTSDGPDAGKIALNESWAEYIGSIHQLRYYNNNCVKRGTFGPYNGGYYPGSLLLEKETYFFEYPGWIPYGLYHDILDVNIAPNDPDEGLWDGCSGFNINALYQGFGPNVNNLCDYCTSFYNNTLNSQDRANLLPLFYHYQIFCPQ